MPIGYDNFHNLVAFGAQETKLLAKLAKILGSGISPDLLTPSTG